MRLSLREWIDIAIYLPSSADSILGSCTEWKLQFHAREAMTIQVTTCRRYGFDYIEDGGCLQVVHY